MTENADALQRQIEALNDRATRLSAAVLRIGSSLDLDTVLQEAVDSARALTGARYGVITTVDDSGRVQDFVTSGFTKDEQDQLATWSDGPRLFQHFRDLASPLRLGDLPTYVQALGFSPDLMRSKTLQGTPMRHGDAYVGNFFIAEKEGGQEFSSADEEVLTLFASQAASAIANARTHHDERQARAGLEALIEMSPVGVVVFDGGTGKPVSFNREARRIVECLSLPEWSPEQLLDSITCRRADGREIAVGDYPLAQAFSTGEMVRAEEMTLSVPDGRSVTTLVSSTPIPSTGGAVESVVVTLQDLAPLEDLERLRAEFLSLVSHELRTPLVSIKGSTATALGASPVPKPAEMLQFFRIIDQQADHMRGLIGDLLDHGRIATGTLSVSPEPTEVAALVDEARGMLPAGASSHPLSIDLPEDLPQVMVDPARIVQVFNNLFSNAARHSLESSPIRVSAVRDGVDVAISVEDKGRGLSADQLRYLFRKSVDVGGAEPGHGLRAGGLGLAICKGLVEAHGGRIWAESDGVGRGACFTFTVPVADDAHAAAVGSSPSRSRRALKGGERPRVLVVDDDPHTLRYVRDALTQAGYSPIVTGDPQDLASLIRMHEPRLVLLDLLLPGTDGIKLMERVPELGDVPVIFISAYGREETVVRALDAGADDYIVKPFSPSELTARVRAALRRRAEPERFVLGELAIQYEERRVAVGGRPVELTATEYELLRVLSINAGRVLTYDALLRQAWRGRGRASRDPKLVRAVVKRLRRKLDDDANPRYIRNERGVGYRMPAPADR